ncbi:cdc42 effector protein 4-like [Syngnathus acus]|uniref:cdc42 effector protein 4-like n=1 Tax=Syngnathus acus TaxID=161584 RepID=UPI001885B069|nr:cdc42 effector protein 4-like [Syngnathus acus]XP_037113177.1 cdc42 effector protein 4-like [Syngnathus acus]XP_037113178.1 cdc42 effector protein 4-like [Syngnathus acus]XP_037113179.1 cdc42 effector protein 4-like [Syngnathus acus]XP_037113180.1 cdc42 effector protein 4-like [Syngnathus acus]XP_037113181.1 cdc42 effector protein 4-like [Syngnathus acus]
MPILKQPASGFSQKKRHSRSNLSREMISAPLGDFRHTMHVGRSGNAFGDTSFLGTRSGQPTTDSASFPGSPRPGLLSRAFRSSKRSQSTTRVDQQRELSPLRSEGSSPHVKSAMSLPFLNDEDGGHGAAAETLSPGPLKRLGESGAAAASAAGSRFPEQVEPGSEEIPERRGMKHAESVTSFHVDLGPSMLGDILGVMEKEDVDLEEGKGGEGCTSPLLGAHHEDNGRSMTVLEKEEEACWRTEMGAPHSGRCTPQFLPKHSQHPDSRSVSSSGSAARLYSADTDSTSFSAPPEEESHFLSFFDDEDDEIRV